MNSGKPKIVLNTTTLNQGGVLQRIYSFIDNVVAGTFNEFEWEIFLSSRVKKEIEDREMDLNIKSKLFSISPAKSFSVRKQIRNALNDAKPDLVFTFAGPSYIRHRWPELMGVADGWVTHSSSVAFRSVPRFSDRMGLKLSALYKLIWFRRSRLFINQTETGKQGIVDRFGAKAENVYIVPNALASWYEIAESPTPRDKGEPLNIFYFSGAYSHKRHDVLPKLCHELRKQGEENFKIWITLSEENPLTKNLMSNARALNVDSHIVNFGRVPVTRGLDLYAKSHICFMPSVLETFSATYLEAMATRTPVVASDFPFAREICGDAALYVDPDNAAESAKKILKIASDGQLQQELTDKGTRQLAKFPDVTTQMEIYRKVFNQALSAASSSKNK